MKALDFFAIALRGLLTRRTRSWLTMIGIFIGITAVVALISLGQGMQNAITSQFEMLGSDKITVMPGGTMMGAPMSTETMKLTERDVEVIDGVRGIKSVVGLIYGAGKIEFDDETKYTYIIGMPEEEQKRLDAYNNFEVAQGRWFGTGDTYKVVVGSRLATGDFFKDKMIGLRDRIMINGKKFEVVGVAKVIGNHQDDSQVYIPQETAKEIFKKGDDVDMIIARIDAGYEPKDVADRVETALRRSRNVKKGEEDFMVSTSQQLMDTFKTVFAIVQAVIVGIAAISLMVGGVGITNTMYTAVLERRKEIGIMKAVGARNIDIAFIFLIEAGTLGLVGGIIGVLLGAGLSKSVELIARPYLGTTILSAAFPLWLILGALAFSFTIGSLSGSLPAIQAARLKPVDTLRYE